MAGVSQQETSFRVGELMRLSGTKNTEQEERGTFQERGREWRASSLSPRRREWSQREQQPDESVRRSNEQRKLTEENATGGSQPEVRFRIGETTRMVEPYNTGKFREEALQTVSSESGSIMRVNKDHKDVASYFLRAGPTRRK